MRFIIKVLIDFVNSPIHFFSIVTRSRIDNKQELIKFKQKIKITMIDISCNNPLPKECRDIHSLHQFS